MNSFLDKNGEKKFLNRKGNGITIEDWLKYASPESLSLYMYQNPKRAKKALRSSIKSKTVDNECLELLEKFPKQKDQEKILNPIWHVHNGQPPKGKISIPFSMLLNLVSTSQCGYKGNSLEVY